MDIYTREIEKETLKGVVFCGAREGYTGAAEHSLESILEVLDTINKERKEKELFVPPCMISEATLVGRSREENYREKIYKFEFTVSPRSKPVSKEIFHNTLIQYVNALGTQLKQERVYLEFDGKTSVYHR